MTTAHVIGEPKVWLRIDGLLLFVSTIVIFRYLGQEWWVYPMLLFIPDVFMIGYFVSSRVGAFIYNLGHSYVAPLLMVLIAWSLENNLALAVGVIWLGHIGMDRFLGYGLKYNTGFKHTHLGDLSKAN